MTEMGCIKCFVVDKFSKLDEANYASYDGEGWTIGCQHAY